MLGEEEGETIETEAYLAAREIGVIFLKETVGPPTINVDLKKEISLFSDDDEESPSNQLGEKLSKQNVEVDPVFDDTNKKVGYTKHQKKYKKKKLKHVGESLKKECDILAKNTNNEEIDTNITIHENANVELDEGIKKKHSCDICQSEFKRRLHLIQHLKDAHPGVKIPCDLCDKSFSSVGSKETHINTVHAEVKRYPCEKCGKSFTTYGIRKTHMENVHETNKHHFCEKCEKSFSSSGNLKTHIEKAHNTTPVPCPHCGKSFQYMESHIKHVHEIRRAIFTCEECGKSFKSKKDVSKHKRIHLPDDVKKALKEKELEKHQCNLCGQRFPDSTRLKIHESSKHTGIKNFFCQYCPNSYFRSDHLKTHVNNSH